MSESTNPIRVLIADSRTLFRETLKKVFQSERRFAIVGEAGDGEKTIELVRKLEPDVLLMDWRLPQLSGLEVLRSLSSGGAKTRPILLTTEIERDQIPQAFQLGARGLVLKEASVQVLFSSIASVISGKYWMRSESFSDLDHMLKKLSESTREDTRPKNFSLTPRELKIVSAVAAGHTNKQIAKQFSISEQTVKHHITNIFDKLGVYNRLELTLFALHHKLIEDSD